MPGRKPKPTAQHHVEGTYNATRHSKRSAEPQPTGKPIKPPFVKGKASKIWEQYARLAYWLTEADSHSFAIWCGLMAEAERGIDKMVASRISQLRSVGAELGLAGPSSRTRINVLTVPPSAQIPTIPGEQGQPEQDPGEKYFN